MLKLLSIVCLSSASLTIYSPSSISRTEIEFKVSTFGTPALFYIIGQVEFKSVEKCELIGDFSNKFIVTSLPETCSYEEVALSAERSQAKLIIFALNTLSIILPSNRDLADLVSIPVIGISYTESENLKNYREFVIWASVIYEMIPDTGIKISWVLSGNYSLDYKLFEQLYLFQLETDSDDDSLTMVISYFDQDSDLKGNFDDDCLLIQNQEPVCMQTSNNVKGKDKILNSIKIIKYLFSSTEINSFFENINKVYIHCKDDYSSTCIDTFIDVPEHIDGFSNFLIFVKAFQYAPYFTLNEVLFFWPSNFSQATLRSDSNSEVDYTRCAPECTNKLLWNSDCDHECNFEECGFDDLTCKLTDGCLSNMLGDSQCDEVCLSDPDCKACSIGCYYQDMEQGFCPYTCTDECFNYCSNSWCSPGCNYGDMRDGMCSEHCSDNCYDVYCYKAKWCSPGCLFSDLQIGLCSDTCSDSCKSQCQNECDAGCYYSDMRIGLCPSSCSGNCFEYCNPNIYCSAGCTWYSLKSGSCSESCSPDCMKSCIECSPGCYYSDWEIAICSNDCTETCKEKCENYLCSTGCPYSIMDSGSCPYTCSDKCYENYCDSSKYCSSGCSYSSLELDNGQFYCSEKCRNWYNSGCYTYCGSMDTCDSSCKHSDCCKSEDSNDSDKKDNMIIYAIVVPIVTIFIL